MAAHGEVHAKRYVAKPGYSEHHTALALDLTPYDTCGNEVQDDDYEAYGKLHPHLHEFGFILRYPAGKEDVTGYPFEPWHIRYVGVDAAREIYENGWTLEEYVSYIDEAPGGRRWGLACSRALEETTSYGNTTIRENLAYVKPDVTDEEMVRACRACCIHDDIMELDHGYDTVISEGGRDLSGGQRQRIAIARGLLCDARILLMDESTSALDNTTQREVLKAVKGMAGNRTVMMIAHRLSTIANADAIFFIGQGKVLAHGTHEELMETCDEYRELYQAEQVEAAY